MTFSFKTHSLISLVDRFLLVCTCPDTSGTVRKTGGNFKEKFREFGGLDAVFEVAMNCHSTLEV